MRVIRFARENRIPYFGLCYGMQLATIEYARNVAGLKGAHDRDRREDAASRDSHTSGAGRKARQEELRRHDAVGCVPVRTRERDYRCGKLWCESITSERHRHRYEVNPEYVQRLEDAGLVFSGKSPDGHLMEIAELPKSVHPFFLGTQFHPK